MNKHLLKVIFLLSLICTTTLVLAQDPPDPGEDPDAPIDGGIVLLAAAGATMGYKALTKKKTE